jgi:hypothetical protein
LADHAISKSHTLRRNRLIALVAAVAMVVGLCGYISHEPAGGAGPSGHCDWTVHFLGVAGSAPHPVPAVKPLLAAWVMLPVAVAASRSGRKLRAHLARGPPGTLSIG